MLRPIHFAQLVIFCIAAYLLGRTIPQNGPTPAHPHILPIEAINNLKPADWKTDFESKLTVESSMPYEEYTGLIEKSGNDKRQYRLVRLPNNLIAVCIQDTEAKEAAASLSVNVGSNANPAKFQGALDRFAQFFISPLFNADCVDRELKAVDSEYKGNLQSDGWRIFQLAAFTSDPAHPYSGFNVGNTETLKGTAEELGLDLREELIKFYQKYYSADIMRLAVVGNHSLDTLTEWVTSKFSDIKSKGDTKPMFDIHPIGEAQLGKLIHYQTVREGYELTLQFSLPELKSTYGENPFAYISALLSHREPGSIYSVLRKNGWATSINAGVDGMSNDGFSTYDIDVIATPEGLENYEAIVSIIFGYINMLVEIGPQEWYYKELSLINKAEFDFKDKEYAENCVLGITSGGTNQYVPPQHILSHDSLLRGYNANLILKCLSYLNPGNYRMFIGAQEHKEVECNLEEKYYGIRHHIADLPSHMTSNVDAQQFAIHFDKVKRMIQSRKQDSPLQRLRHQLDVINIVPALDSTMLEESLKDVTIEGLQTHIESVFDKAYVKMLVTGNYNQSVALDVGNQVLDILQPKPAPISLLNSQRSLDIEPGYYVQNVPIGDMKCLNSAVVSAFYCGSVNNTREATVLQVLERSLHSAFFAQLRTLEQLGYRVGTFKDSTLNGRDMLTFYVEGESNPVYVTQRINQFICQYRLKLQELTIEEFESSVQSLISIKQEKLKSIDDEFFKMWSPINSDKYNFDKLDDEIEHLKQLSKNDLLAFWDKYVNEDTAQPYTRLDMQMSSAKIWQPTAEEFEVYPSTVLALYGTLRSDGHTALTIAEVQSFVSLATPSSNIDSLLADLSDLYLSKQMQLVADVNEPRFGFESSSKVATALQMAINSVDEAPKFAALSKTNFTNIDMKQSPEGVWLIHDYKQFQRTQALHGISVPTRKLVPIIPEATMEEGS
ncbi:metalloprotease [Coemansia sp. 'formosensis']|nr:metalloprotease [Coemansia sp. 'formosensis']